MGLNWKKIEKQAQRNIGSRPTPASGALPGQKADGRHGASEGITGSWRVETKSTAADSFRATPKILNKLEKDANVAFDNPMLQVNFINHSRRVYVVPVEHVDIYELEESTNEIEPYDSDFYFDSRNGKRYAVLSEEMAKFRLGLEDS